ncbi:MAG TPA: hypothetical protein V6C58_24940, partial [Allocoleopsis sp.]
MAKIQLQNKDIKNVTKSGDNINLNLIITEMKKVKKRIKKVKQEALPPEQQAPPPAPVPPPLPDLVQYSYRQFRNIGTRPYDLQSTEINPANIPIPEYQQNYNYIQRLRMQQAESLVSQLQQLQQGVQTEQAPVEQQGVQTEQAPVEQQGVQTEQSPVEQQAVQTETPVETPKATYEGSVRYGRTSQQPEEAVPSSSAPVEEAPEVQQLTEMMQGLTTRSQAEIQQQINTWRQDYSVLVARVEEGESKRKFNRP